MKNLILYFTAACLLGLPAFTALPVQAKSAPKVEVLVANWCPYCQKLEKFLKEKKIPYTRYDLERSKKGRQMYNQLGRGGIPITKIGSYIIRGYQPREILRALERESTFSLTWKRKGN